MKHNNLFDPPVRSCYAAGCSVRRAGAGLLAGCMLALSLAACGASSTETDSRASSAAGGSSSSSNSSSASSGFLSSETPAASGAPTAAAAAGDAITAEYTDRDRDASYEESTATAITCNGDSAAVSGSGVTVENGVVTITAEGVYILRGSLSGQVIVEADAEEKVQLVLDGLAVTSADGPALYIKQADKVFLTLAEGSENALTDSAAYTLAEGEDEPNACLFSKDDLTINGSGSLTVTGNYNHGIFSKDDLKICGGSITVSAVTDGIKGKDCVAVCGGTLNITAGDDGIQSSNDSDTACGWVSIDGGDITISAEGKGITAVTTAAVNGGNLLVAKSYEGIEGAAVSITGGSIDLTASDDGINAASDTGAACAISVSGGTVLVDASGDGLDSNGSLDVSGGVLLVSGPTSSGDGALDYDTTGSITGGTVVIAGSSGMAQNFSTGTQGAALVTTGEQPAGTRITLADESGNVLASWTPRKVYGCVIFSAAAMVQDGTYTVLTGGTLSAEDANGFADSGTLSGGETLSTVTLDTLISGGSMGGGMGGMGGKGGGFGKGGRDFTDDGTGNAPDGPLPEGTPSEGTSPDGSSGTFPGKGDRGQGTAPDALSGATETTSAA